MSEELPRFTGRLTPEKIAAGINAATRNAQRLSEDAKLLLTERRFPSATALAILAIEEAGKRGVLRGLATASTPDRVKRAWREYRSHTQKNSLGGFLDAFSNGARRLLDFKSLFDHSTGIHTRLDLVKQIALYTDCYGAEHWSEPDNVIDEDLARTMVQTAEIVSGSRETTARELELWVEVLGPVIGGELKSELLKPAMVRWYQRMQEEGLLEPGPNPMDTFV